MTEFLSEAELRALEKVIGKARQEDGVHREATPDGEAIAYQLHGDIEWFVSAGADNVARGSCPKTRRS